MEYFLYSSNFNNWISGTFNLQKNIWANAPLFNLYFFNFKAVKMVYVEKFDVCYIKPKGSFSVYNVQLNNRKGINSYVTGTGELHEDLDSSKLKVDMFIYNCT